eukprot:525121-Amphidinium_carterae.3
MSDQDCVRLSLELISSIKPTHRVSQPRRKGWRCMHSPPLDGEATIGEVWKALSNLHDSLLTIISRRVADETFRND